MPPSPHSCPKPIVAQGLPAYLGTPSLELRGLGTRQDSKELWPSSSRSYLPAPPTGSAGCGKSLDTLQTEDSAGGRTAPTCPLLPLQLQSQGLAGYRPERAWAACVGPAAPLCPLLAKGKAAGLPDREGQAAWGAEGFHQ